jgi:hypothetical protein
MKIQHPKFKVGDIIQNSRNNFRRQIQSVDFEERSGIKKVIYTYCGEELNKLYAPTGKFDPFHTGRCSQDHLLQWQSGW